MTTKSIPWLTHAQHLQWGLKYPSEPVSSVRLWESRRNAPTASLYFTVGRCTRPPLSWATEFKTALQLLVDTHGTRLALFYSGGADSEAVLRGLVSLGVRPEVHVIKFKGKFNAHETDTADQVCAELGLVPHIWEHDVHGWLSTQGYMDLGVKYECDQIAYLTVLEYVRRAQDLPVVMGGEIYVQKHQVPDGSAYTLDTDWYYVYRENEDGATYRYTQDTGHPLINEIMTYTPELLASFLLHPEIVRVVENKVPGKITMLSIKGKVYEDQFGHPLGARVKYHGYERLQWSNLWARTQIREALGTTPMQARIPYSELLNNLIPTEYGHDNKTIDSQ